jgi:hypothetical protein
MNFADIKMSYKYVGFNTRKESMHNMNDYRVTIKYNGKSFTFDYSMGTALKESDLTIKAVMFSLLSDASFYECSSDLMDFSRELGYDCNDKQALSAYKSCKATSLKLNEMFTSNELESMREQLEDY